MERSRVLDFHRDLELLKNINMIQKVTNGMTGDQSAQRLYDNDLELKAANDATNSNIASFTNAVPAVPTTRNFVSGGSGFWAGTVGAPPTITANANFRWMALFPVNPNSPVVAEHFYAPNSSTGICIFVDAAGNYISRQDSGAGFATGNFSFNTPVNCAFIGFMFNASGGVGWPIANAVITTTYSGFTIKNSAMPTVTARLDLLEASTAPVTPKVTYPKDMTIGNTGGTAPGNPFTSAYIFNKAIVGTIKSYNFIASTAGDIEVLFLTENAGAYDVEVVPMTVVVGNNLVTTTKVFNGRIGVRCITGKFYFVSNDTSSSISSVAITEGAPTPATLPKASVESGNLPNWNVSLQVKYTGLQEENAVLRRLDLLEASAGGGAQLIGSKYAALGDSITAFSQGNTYASRVAAWAECVEYTNVAIGGATWGWRAGTTPTPDPNPSGADDTNVMSNQVLKLMAQFDAGLLTKPDFITLSAVINDVSRGIAIGDVATEFAKPLADVNMYTVVGAIRYCVSTLMVKFPDVRMFLLTPLHTSVAARTYIKSKPYADAIVECGRRLSVPIIDCLGASLINEVNEARYMQADKLHPNSLGQQMQALFVYRELKNRYYNLIES